MIITENNGKLIAALRKIGALSTARKLFTAPAMPGVLKPEEINAMKQAIFACCDSGLEPICF